VIVGAASAIQVWTLVVATLAVLASVGGIIANAQMSARSEHQTWKRDLRSQYYTALDDEVENVKRTLGKSPSPSKQEKIEAFYLLYPKMTNVTTYGTSEVWKDPVF
jgi:hypothetical protein